MPAVIEISGAAIADFDHIYDSISKHNPQAAAKTLRDLDAAIQHLSDQPNMGRAYRHGRHRLRLLTHGDYLVFYRTRPGVTELVRILHGRQNIPDILDEL
jgi:plasmid stabilization system protein ParE